MEDLFLLASAGMQDILSPAGLLHLRSFFMQRPMVVFDFDGTLAALSQDRAQVQMTDLTRALVSRLSQWLPVGVVSGRGLADLADRFHGLDRVLLAGNHGGESEECSEPGYRMRLAQASADVQDLVHELTRIELIPSLPSHALENKHLSLTFHWRGVDPELARKWGAEIRRVALETGNFRIIPGVLSLSVVPRELSDKGDATLGLLEAGRKTHLVYLGDEETDEDVFRKAAGRNFLGIRVGEDPDSAAEWFVSAQSEVDRVIEVFLALAAGPATATMAVSRPAS